MRIPHPTRRPRAASIAALLVLALGFAGLLALQALGASQYQKAQAERVLRDYSAFAANRFAVRSAQNLWYWGFVPAIKTIDHLAGKLGHLPSPGRLPAAEDSLTTAFFGAIRYIFHLDTANRTTRFGGRVMPEAWRRWLADTVVRHIRSLPPTEDVAAVLGGPPAAPPDPSARMLVVFTVPRAAPRAQARVLGFAVAPDAVLPYFSYVATSAPLLPRALTGGVALDSIGSVAVRDAAGTPIYRTEPQYPSSIVGHDTLGHSVADLRVDVSLRPEIAGKLVIGGLPRSRLPLLAGLLVLTAGLIVIALIQLKRESDLAALRTQFVSGVSHELRTPLAQIRMFAETLVLGRVRSEDERRRSLAIIDQEARRLTTLVENLLHFSRSERQTLRVAPVPTLLGPLVRAVLESFSPLAEARRVRLATSLADGVVACVDEGAMRQMLLNLLDNAVKYGPEGQVVTAGVESVRGGDRVRVWVQDQGPGIPASERERIWERFWRLERDRGSAVAGTGIGLSVVCELAALHGGRAWVETAPGGGARFVIDLPAGTLAVPPPPAAPGGATEPAVARIQS
jgi:signal transduction histidine kinase